MAQQITPELKRWIVEQASAGFTPDAVVKAMRESGWTEEVALQALELALTEHLASLSPQRPLDQPAPAVNGHALAAREAEPHADAETDTADAEAVEPLARASVIPHPSLQGSPCRIDAGDRLVEVLVSMHSPRLVVFGNLLSDAECDALIAAARPRMSRSLTVQTSTGGEELNADRTSNGMFFRRGENETVSRVEARIARLLNWPLENGEGLQVLHYRPGAEYRPHYDYFDPSEPGTANIVRRGGQRVATLVMYLNEPEGGGGTTFPDIGFEVMPRRGNAVFFAYDRPSPSTKTLHGGAPVLAGEKWVATKWLREREFA